jgi:hypothetical protein
MAVPPRNTVKTPKPKRSIFDNFIDSISGVGESIGDIAENIGESAGSFAKKTISRNVESVGLLGEAVESGLGSATQGAMEAASKLGYTSPYAGIKATEAAVSATASGASPERVGEIAKKIGTEAAAKQKEANLGLGSGALGGSLGLTGKVLEGAEQAWSYGVARPLSTGVLLSDERLYQEGVIEQLNEEGGTEVVKTLPGFQWDDVRQAWNRSEDVSFGQAATYSLAKTLTEYNIPVVSEAIEEANLNAYDPWSVSDMADAIENPYFNALSGGLDIGTQIFVPPAIKAARLASVNKLGLRSQIKSGDDLAEVKAEYLAYKEWKDTDRNSGSNTTIGAYVAEAAQETNPSILRNSPIVANSSGVDKGNLAGILAKTTDEDTIANIYLANMGDVDAIRNLADAAPDHVWALADMNSMITANSIDGVRFRPKGEELIRVNQIFDSAINRDEYFINLRDSFTTRVGDDVVVRGPGSTWMPSKSMLVEKVRMGRGKSVYALKNADYSVAPQWVQRVADSKFGGPTTIFIQWAGSRQPLGYVTKSGARPDDWSIEYNAVVDSIPALRGNRTIIAPTVNEFGAVSYGPKDARVWRNEWNQRLNEANSKGNLQNEWMAFENEAVVVMARTLDVDPDVAIKFVEGYRTQLNAAINDLQENGGFIFDEAGSKISIDPISQRQLLNSFATLPMADIYSLIRSEVSNLRKYSTNTSELLTSAFDAGMKIFRTDVLFRPGYTGKNSILEPLISSYLGHGTILSDEGVRATIGNFGINRLNAAKRTVYLLDMDRFISNKLKGESKKSRRTLRNELRELVRQRYDAQDEISGLLIELEAIKSGKVSPALARINEPEIRGKLMDAQTRMDAINGALDDSIPEWRQVVEPANMADVSAKIREYNAIIGLDDQYVKDLYDELGGIYARSYEGAQVPTRNLKEQMGQIDSEIKAIDNALKNRSEDYNIPGLDVSEIGVADVGAGRNIPGRTGTDADVARGRDLQAIALQRRRTSLQEQFDAAKEKLRKAEETGIDAFTDFPLSVNDQMRVDRITTTIARIESSSTPSPELVKQIDNLKKLYDNVVEETTINTSNPNPRLATLEETLEKIDAAIAKTQSDLGERKAKLQSVSGLEGYRGSGRGTMTVVIGGEKVQVPAAFSNNAYDFGEGYRAEASASTSNRLLYDPSSRANYEAGRWERSNRPLVIDRNDPLYFDELAHVSNRYFRGDPLIQRILEGQSRADVAEWLMTKEGKAYQRKMGKPYLTPREPRVQGSGLPNVDAGTMGAPRKVILESTTELDEIYRIVDQYIPDENVKKLIASKEVTGGELQEILGARTDLGRIAGDDLQFIPSSGFAQAAAKVNTALDNIWQFIATMPEDRVARWPFYQREFKYQMQNRIDILESQGVKVSENQVVAMRQASHRAALGELEKTFYNIRRYNNPVYMSRFLMSFPGSFFNSLYRYGRFAIKEPERFIQTGVFASSIIENMGVDENGNKAKSLNDAVALVIPGTKGNVTDTGIRFPVSSFGSVAVGLPSLSFPMMFTVSSINSNNPTTADNIKNAIGETAYNEIFPFGIPEDPKTTILGSYQKDLIKIFQGESNEDFQQISVQFYADKVAQWEQSGAEGDAPTFEEAVAEANSFLRVRTLLKWASPFSVDYRPDGQIMRDSWYDALSMFPGDTRSAREYYMKMYGDWAQWYTYSSTQYTGYVPSTADAYDRIWVKYPNVTRDIVALGEDSPEYLSLFALGTEGVFNPSISKYMKNNPFPGDTQNVASKMSPEKFDNMVRLDRGWADYTASRAKYDSEIARLRILRDEATTEYTKDQYRQKILDDQASWKEYIEQYSKYNPAWAFEFNAPVGSKSKNATIVLKKIISDKKFAKNEGKTDLWQGVKSFLDSRDAALKQVAATTDSEEKDIIKQSFSNWVNESLLDYAPEFTGAWQRFYAKEWTVE